MQYVSQYALLQDRYEIMTIWPVGDSGGSVNSGCASPGSLCIPRGDDAYIVFSVFDTDGDEFDISDASEIVFAVADSNGGQVRFVKRLSAGEITISGNMYQFTVRVNGVDTASLIMTRNYYEVGVAIDGMFKTVSAGLFKSTDTIIKDI